MADRLVRSELLESPRFNGLTSDTARICYVALLLSADSFGNFDGNVYRLRRLWRDFNITTDEQAAKVLTELADVELVVLYEVNSKRLIHIPRFNQRLRYKTSEFPPPPWQAKIINGLLAESQEQSGEDGLSQGKPAEVKRSEEKRRTPSAPNAIAFDAERWQGITDEQQDRWCSAYPALNVARELHAAHAWALANPKNRKSNWHRFLVNWLARAQERAPRVPTEQSRRMPV